MTGYRNTPVLENMRKLPSPNFPWVMLYNSPVKRCVLGSLLLFLLLCTGVSAQAPGKSKLSYKLLSIHVNGLELVIASLPSSASYS